MYIIYIVKNFDNIMVYTKNHRIKNNEIKTKIELKIKFIIVYLSHKTNLLFHI